MKTNVQRSSEIIIIMDKRYAFELYTTPRTVDQCVGRPRPFLETSRSLENL